MIRGLSFILLVAAAVSAGCNRTPENREAVQKAIVEHLSKNAALDMNQLNVEMGEVRFEGNEATATVAIKPKTSPEHGMSMTYTLERRGSDWLVKGRGAGHGGAGMNAPPAASDSELPSGHPPVNKPGEASSGELPAGHPPVNSPAPKTK